MKIEVTQKDIERGVQAEYAMCPIALAFKRKTKFKQVEVGLEYIDILQQGKRAKSYELPRKAKTFIKRFDKNETVKPFSFELEKL